MWKHGGDIYGIASRFGCNPEDIYDFSANISPFGLPNSVRKALIENLDSAVNYPQPGNPELVSSIAAFLKTREDYVIPGNGATEIIYLAVRAICPRRALLVVPCFSEYERALSSVNSVIDTFYLREENAFEMDATGLVRRMDGDYQMLILCNPNNPTGTITGNPDLERIIKCALDRDMYVLIDEAFMDYVLEEHKYSALRLVDEYKNLIIIRALTKFFAIPGLRLGYGLISNRSLSLRMESLKEPWSVNILAERAGIAALQDKDYINMVKNWCEQERHYLYNAISGIEILKPFRGQANFHLVKIDGDGMNSRMLRERMIQRKMLIRDGSSFRGLGDRFFRVAVKTRKQNLKLIKELGEVLPGEASYDES